MKVLSKWWRFQIRQWNIRAIQRNEQSTKKLMDSLDLDYEDVNLRQAVKIAIKESKEWLESNMIN